jgi:peptidoglycan/xylan/chitin deacetylase (PgdA/CDA1 family)
MFFFRFKLLMLGWFLLVSVAVSAQSKNVWKGKKCAVALTYDDALNVHLDNAAPALDSLGLKGTFYLSGYSGALTNRMEAWRALAANGHELGNHTLYHPCAGKPQGRDFVVPEYDLDTYTVKRMADEIKMTNALLKALDGKTKRTFAYPCGDTLASGFPYYPLVKNEFVAARGVQARLIEKAALHPTNAGSFMVNGQTGDQLIGLVKQAMARNSAIVFLFHGVGGEHGLNVSLPAHHQLLRFLKENEKDIWVAPFLEIAEYTLAQPTTAAPKTTRKGKK